MIYTGHRRCSHISLPQCNCHRLRSVTWHANVALYDELSTVRREGLYCAECAYKVTHIPLQMAGQATEEHRSTSSFWTCRLCFIDWLSGRNVGFVWRTQKWLLSLFFPTSPNWLAGQGANSALKELHLDRDSPRDPEEVIHKPHITQRLASLSSCSVHINCSLLWE